MSGLTFCCRLCPVDSILTRMGAYDNMFANSSTFKVELDEWYVNTWVSQANLEHCSDRRDKVVKSSAMQHQSRS